jgi:chemotaxis protein CheY-P-specific phosphatase CheC
LAEGVKDYLHKPFTPEEFKEVMESLWSKEVTETTHLLTQALTQTLETMAFTTAIPVDEDMLIPQETILAEIKFTGAKEGKIQILAGIDFCKILAENIAAIDEANSQSALDALRELANVTCGLFLPMVVSSTADVFDITVPQAESCDNPSQWDKFTADKGCSILNIEGYAIAAKLTVENNVMVTESN